MSTVRGTRLPAELLSQRAPKVSRWFWSFPASPGDPEDAALRVTRYLEEYEIETAEGSVAMAETPGKGFAVLTRLPSGQLGFRQLLKVSASGPVPLLRVVFDSGQSAVVATSHPVGLRGTSGMFTVTFPVAAVPS